MIGPFWIATILFFLHKIFRFQPDQEIRQSRGQRVEDEVDYLEEKYFGKE